VEAGRFDGEENRRGHTPSEEQSGRAVEPPRLARPPHGQRKTTRHSESGGTVSVHQPGGKERAQQRADAGKVSSCVVEQQEDKEPQ
jgi:hypothetical protein